MTVDIGILAAIGAAVSMIVAYWVARELIIPATKALSVTLLYFFAMKANNSLSCKFVVSLPGYWWGQFRSFMFLYGVRAIHTRCFVWKGTFKWKILTNDSHAKRVQAANETWR